MYEVIRSGHFSVPGVGVSQKQIEAELKSITVTLARPEEKTGKMPFGMEGLVPPLWHTALVEALNRMAIFQDDGPKKVSLSVKVLKLEVDAGFSMVAHTAARYELIDRKTGDLIYTQDIKSSGATPTEYSLSGSNHVPEAINRAVQNNITQFLQALETINFAKPMFPVKR